MNPTYTFDDDALQATPDVKTYVPVVKIIRLTRSDMEEPHPPRIYRVIQDTFSPSQQPKFYKVVRLSARPNSISMSPGPLHVVNAAKRRG